MDYLLHLLVMVLIYATLVVSLDLQIGHSGILTFAHASFYGIGAYATAILTVYAGLNWLPAMILALPVGWLVYFSLTDASGAFSLANFHQTATNPQFVTPFLTTLMLATSVGLIACAVAAPVGWLVARTDMPLDRKSTRLNSSHT